MALKRHIPNFFTALNIVSGSIAILFALQSDLLWAFYFIVIAAFFDFIDGGVARLLNTQSEVGKQLDSLCDVVSFGVAPGFIMFSLMRNAMGISLPLMIENISFYKVLLLLSPVLIPVFSAVRLAKFNLDTRQTDSFIGLPVPANALFIASLGVILIQNDWFYITQALLQPVVLLLVIFVQSYLLISPLPMFALKFKSLKWSDNQLRFLFLLIAGVLLVVGGMSAIALVIFLYVLVSLIVRLIKR